MSLLSIILALVVLGLLMYVINVYVPMDSNIKKILNVVVILILIIWLLRVFGLLTFLDKIKI